MISEQFKTARKKFTSTVNEELCSTQLHQKEEKRQALFTSHHLYHSTWGDKTPQLPTAARISGYKEAFFTSIFFLDSTKIKQ